MNRASRMISLRSHWHMFLVIMCVLMVALHLILKAISVPSLGGVDLENLPLFLIIIGAGLPLLAQILVKVAKRDLGADVLAMVAIMTAIILGQYLASTIIIFMLASGQALETFALGRASSVLKALADRMPTHAYLKVGEQLQEVDLQKLKVGDHIAILPHGICPVDGVVYEGRGNMDESYLTGEPYHVPKAPGTAVLSGAINGETLLIVAVEKRPHDSRYAKIIEVMAESQQKRPRLRRLGDQLGAFFIPVSLVFAGMAWIVTGEAMRFLSVLVIATPCPLLIAIPITIISAISMAAKQGIIIKDPVALERLPTCRTAIFDKTGTLTYGKPNLVHIFTAPNLTENRVLQLAMSLERYSKHPLAQAIIKAGRKAKFLFSETLQVSEKSGEGLAGRIGEQKIHITGRKQFLEQSPNSINMLPPASLGLECILTIEDHYAATFQFRDIPRKEGSSFIHHLGPVHNFDRILLVSGDKESEVKHLGEVLGIHEIYSSQSPEQKLNIVHHENEQAPTLFVGDGINDAPALTLATVGIAFGKESNITAEAAGIIVMESTLNKVDEIIHISHAMRKIALQSSIGGMVLSLIGMGFAAAGYITPIMGAILQEGIDVIVILNALRLTLGPRVQVDIKS